MTNNRSSRPAAHRPDHAVRRHALGTRDDEGDDPSRIVGFRQGQTVVPGNNQTMPDDFMTRLRADCRARGFTLVELMITLAVAAILALIAVPSFRRVLVSTNLADVNNALVHDLQYARTEAVSRQTSVAVSASAGNWQNGWTVNIPPASSTGTAIVLRNHAAVPAQYVVSGASTGVTYSAQGSPGAATCFTISPTPAANGQPRYLQVMPAGMLQQTTGGTPPATPNCPAPST